MVKKLEMTVMVDTNDGDFETAITEKDLKKIMPLIDAINKFKPYKWRDPKSSFDYEHTHDHNYPFGEMFREDLGEKPVQKIYKGINKKVFELFEEHCPQPGHGFHTIEYVTVYPIPKKEVLIAQRG